MGRFILFMPARLSPDRIADYRSGNTHIQRFSAPEPRNGNSVRNQAGYAFSYAFRLVPHHQVAPRSREPEIVVWSAFQERPDQHYSA